MIATDNASHRLLWLLAASLSRSFSGAKRCRLPRTVHGCLQFNGISEWYWYLLFTAPYRCHSPLDVTASGCLLVLVLVVSGC